MYSEIIALLMCPICKSELKLSNETEVDDEIIQGDLCCKNGHNWHIHEGVLDFNTKEQGIGNNWSEYYKEVDYDELNRKIKEGTPESLRNAGQKAINKMVEIVSKKPAGYILDIATGRGTLLKELAMKINPETRIIAIDLSFTVLKYDRIKLKEINKNIRINYIACDGANLPIKDSSMDGAVSYFGLGNMLQLMPKGIEEARRVIKDSGYILESEIIIKEDSTGYKALLDFARESNIVLPDKYATLDGIKSIYSSFDSKDIEVKIIEEGIGEKNELDLLPFENEWYALVLMYSKK